MALDPKMLKKFLDNPAQFSADDMGLNDEPGEQLAPDESMDGALQLPETDPEADLLEQAPEIADPDEMSQEADLLEDEESTSAAPAQFAGDADIMEKLRKLKAGEPMDDASQEEVQDIASDMEAPMDLRKKALQKIKQKYLGQ